MRHHLYRLWIEKYLHHPKAPEEKKFHDLQTNNSLHHSLSHSRYSKSSRKDKHNKELHPHLMNKPIKLLAQVTAIIINNNNNNNLKWPRCTNNSSNGSSSSNNNSSSKGKRHNSIRPITNNNC